MNRITVSPSHRRPRTSSEATARFDDRGRMLSASAAFVLMLEERYLVEEILALPRALALRAACGGDRRQVPADSTRRFHHRGTVYRLEAHYMATPHTPDGALCLTIDEDAAAAPARRRSWKVHDREHSCTLLHARLRAGASA